MKITAHSLKSNLIPVLDRLFPQLFEISMKNQLWWSDEGSDWIVNLEPALAERVGALTDARVSAQLQSHGKEAVGFLFYHAQRCRPPYPDDDANSTISFLLQSLAVNYYKQVHTSFPQNKLLIEDKLDLTASWPLFEWTFYSYLGLLGWSDGTSPHLVWYALIIDRALRSQL